MPCVDTMNTDGKRSSSIPDVAELNKYMVKRALKKSFKNAKKLKSFVWKKKIQRDIVIQGVPLDAYSLKAAKKRQLERVEELENARKRKEKRSLEKSQISLRAGGREHSDPGSLSPVLVHINDNEDKAVLEIKPGAEISEQKSKRQMKEAADSMEEGAFIFGSEAEISLDTKLYNWHEKYQPRKPKYSNLIHTGYAWNKYNRTHYDHDNPPPKVVRGYKFNIFYPDLIDKTKIPSYRIEKDGSSSETCIIRFEGGPPYEDIAFRIVNQEWELSGRAGFKCTFENGVLRVHFNFKHCCYKR